MSDKVLNSRIKNKIDSTANWNDNSAITLANGEIGLEKIADGNVKIKIGDGSSSWENLPYILTSDILREQFSQPVEVNDYQSSNEIFPNQTISFFQIANFSTTIATNLKNLVQNTNNFCYLNSIDIPLITYEFEDPTMIGLTADDECYSFVYNFDLSTMSAADGTKPYYVINLLYFHLVRNQNFPVFL